MEFDGFDWDDSNRGKCQKHGVSIGEIESVFGSALRVGPDPFDPTVERRFRAIGRTKTGRPIFVVFTWRLAKTGRLVRPLSARYMHRKEIEAYEEEIS
jgi:uncharacterized DUF497 family protein